MSEAVIYVGNEPKMTSLSDIESHILQGLPLARELGFRIDEISPHDLRARLPYDERMIRPGDSIAGPVLVMLADACLYACILARYPDSAMALTSDLTIHFFKRPAKADLIAKGTLLKAGKTLAVGEVTLYSEGQREAIAHVVGTYALPSKSPP